MPLHRLPFGLKPLRERALGIASAGDVAIALAIKCLVALFAPRHVGLAEQIHQRLVAPRFLRTHALGVLKDIVLQLLPSMAVEIEPPRNHPGIPIKVKLWLCEHSEEMAHYTRHFNFSGYPQVASEHSLRHILILMGIPNSVQFRFVRAITAFGAARCQKALTDPFSFQTYFSRDEESIREIFLSFSRFFSRMLRK